MVLEAGRQRITWLDSLRAWGIFLLFYGHLVESVHRMGHETALSQQKLIYSFHMPLFIVISGYLAKTAMPPLVPFLKKQAATRLLPVVFFSVFMMPLAPIGEWLADWDSW